jgi:hypothetical protein
VNPNLTAVSDEIVTSRPGSGTGNGRSKRLFTRLKIAVFAPIPSPRVSTATKKKAGDFDSIRTA